MKLYYAPGACSLAPHIALREAGLPFDLVKVLFPGKKTETGEDFHAINPKGAVPALALDDGEVLTEAAAILKYVADRAPNARLAPAHGTRERYRLAEWLNYIASELHKGFGPLWNARTPSEYRTIVKENLAKQFAYLERRLAGHDYLLGGDFTVADAYAFTILNWAKHHEVDLLPYPKVRAFMERVAKRPAVQKALAAEGLLQKA